MSLSRMLQTVKRPYHFLKGFFATTWYRNPSNALTILCVTGTDGKTTSATLLYHVLKHAGKNVALVSTVAAYIKEKEIDTGFHVTSPSPFALQSFLFEMKKQGIQYVVLEVTSHGIDQHRFFGIKPFITMLTNITHEHLDYHATYEEYARVKLRLLRRSKNIVINRLDHSYHLIKKTLRMQIESKMIASFEYDTKHISPLVSHAISQRFSESYNQENASGVWKVCELLHLSEEVFRDAVASFPGVVGRMQEIRNGKGIRAIVDFAHTPNALERALQTLRTTKKSQTGKLLVVFGCAGLRDRLKRPMMGRVASELADEVILTAEDPRTESIQAITRQIKDGCSKKALGHIHEIADRDEAIRFAVSLAKKGDTIAVFGKGHEKSLNLDGKHETPWSDQEALLRALT
ncbi:MAG: hypothetical protein A2378_02265 [Candidatus Pacebacteria bacterium RIFOXYB1_FULL_44_10]|nr:MAG: hypothetical protein A2378_02265 [Candidatus Pacebacteria bacterium RIFOXYB1_FULL_44_10]